MEVSEEQGLIVADRHSSTTMSVVEHGRHIAFAAYDEVANRIIIENCTYSARCEVHELAIRISAVIRPTLLLLSAKICSNALLLEALSTPPFTPREGDDTEENIPATTNEVKGSIPYRLLKSSNFDTRTCKAEILKLRVLSLKRPAHALGPINVRTNQQIHEPPTHVEHQMRVSNFHALASLLDFECTAEVQALGSLLAFIQRTTFKHAVGTISVDDIIRAKASMHMTLSEHTFSALHVFATERHPLVASKGSGNSKEGFSLFSFLDRTRSRAGRAQLREWMLKPLIDVSAIHLRQDGVELFMIPEMHNVARSILKLMERISSVDKIIFRIQKCCATYNDFLSLTKALSSAIAIIDTIRDELLLKINQQYFSFNESDQNGQNMSDDCEGVRYITFVNRLLYRCDVDTLNSLFERITSIIDETATFESKSIIIRPGFHTQLDVFKEEFDQLGDTLILTGGSLVQRLPHLQNLTDVIFLPQIGFLVSVQDQVDWTEHGVLTEDFTFIFTEAGRSYFKNDEVRELDAGIGDLDTYIKDIETSILTNLEDDILDCENELRTSFTALAELDCTLAFAACAIDYKYVRPEVVPSDEYGIHILNGRHPLQEIVMNTEFIPNHTNIDSDNRVNIVSGPNFSGKSCYARQVGILTFMAQIGSFIPCDGARIAVVDQIIARFGSVETCALPQSTFQLDLSQMGTALRQATANSLVIIDEFGKGTSPASGIALLTAALRRLSTIHCKVLCTTHFLEVFSMGLLHDGEDGIKALSMAVHIPESTGDNALPLFKLEEGVSLSSAGLVCAKMAGVKDAVVSRAREIILSVKERRKLMPLAEILRDQLDLSHTAKGTLEEFIHSNWKDASSQSINLFIGKISTMT